MGEYCHFLFSVEIGYQKRGKMHPAIYIYFLTLGIPAFILERHYLDNIYNTISSSEKTADHEAFVVVNFSHFVQFSISFHRVW